MVKKLLSFFICFYAILVMFGIEKAFGAGNDNWLQKNQNLILEINKHSSELNNICHDMIGIEQALESTEYSIAETIGNKCGDSRDFLHFIWVMLSIYHNVYNKDDKSRIIPIINKSIEYISDRLKGNTEYINKVSTLSKNYNLVLTSGRLKNKIEEINEDIKKIRFD